MRRSIHLAILCFAIVGLAPELRAQTLPSRGAVAPPLEIALSYSADRAGGSSGAEFWLQGGKAEFSAAFGRNFSFVGEVAAEHVSNINSANEDLGLTSYLFGPRLSLRRSRSFTPFAQVLVGGVHGFDAYFPILTISTKTPDAFAMATGGGVNFRVSRHFAIRPFQADYFETWLPNDANGRENNVRLGGGIVFVISPAE